MTVSSGSLLPTDVHATLPLHIINFLSIDPPVSSPQIPSTQVISNLSNVKTSPILSRPIGTDSERSEENLVEEPIENEDGYYSDEDVQNDFDHDGLTENGGHDLGNLSLHDDADEVVEYPVVSDVGYHENAPRFADLYYSCLQENLDHTAKQHTQDATDNSVSQIAKSDGARGLSNIFASRVHEKTSRRQSERPDQSQESYAGGTRTGAHQVPFSYQPSSYEPRTAGHPDPAYASCGHHAASATGSARHIPPSFQLGSRSSQFSENLYIPAEKQNPALSVVYNTSTAYDADSTLTSAASRSRSVKDKIRELEERAERAKTDT